MFQAFLVRCPCRDSNEFREMDFDKLRDYIDQDFPAVKFLTAQSGPIAQFWTDMPDWMNMIPEDLNQALNSLLIPSEGPMSSAVSFQEVIQVI